MMKLSFELISAIIDVIRITTSGAVNWFSVWKITFLESTSDNGLDIGILFLCKFFLLGLIAEDVGLSLLWLIIFQN